MTRALVNSLGGMVSEVVSTVKSAKTSDPFAAVTVVAANYHVADRAVSRALSQAKSTWVNVSPKSGIEILNEICIALDHPWDFEKTSRDMPDAIRAALQKSSGDWRKVDPSNDSNIAAIAKLVRKMDWVDISKFEDKIDSRNGEHLTQITSHTVELLGLIQIELATRGAEQPGLVLESIRGHESARLTRAVCQVCPNVVSIDNKVPNVLLTFIEEFGASVTNIDVRVETDTISSPLRSAPDPLTECSVAIDLVGDAIRNGASPTSVAIGYTDADEYLPVLAQVLEESTIEWFGKTADNLLATPPVQAFLIMLEIAERYANGNTVNRENLLKLFSLGNVPVQIRKSDGTYVDVPLERAMARYLIEESLFGDSESWRANLAQVKKAQEEYSLKLESFDEHSTEDEAIELRRLIRKLTAAVGLLATLNKFDESFAAVGDLDGVELAELCFDTLGKIYWTKAWRSGRIDRGNDRRSVIAFDNVRRFLGTVSAKGHANFDSVRSQFTTEIEARSLVHGTYRSGIVVAPMAELSLSDWDFVLVVGCDESSAFNTGREDPLLPDFIVEQFTKLGVNELASSRQRKLRAESAFHALGSVSGKSAFSFARGGNLKNRESKAPSIFADHADPITISRPWEYVENAVNTFRSETRSFKRLVTPTAVAEIAEGNSFRSAVAFRRPQDRDFFGVLTNVGALGGEEFFSRGPMSSSYVEQFLECPHNFFVTRVLKIADDEGEAEIDEVKATDYGIAVHNAFQHLIDPHATSYPKELPGCSHVNLEDLIPASGAAFAEDARQHLIELYEFECNALVDRNVAGWGPRFREKKRMFKRNSSHYLLLDHAMRNFEIEWNRKVGPGGAYTSRTTFYCEELDFENKLAPRFAEFEFGYGERPTFEISISVDGEIEIDMSFRGRIDRIDSNDAGTSVNVVDYKTGKADSLIAKAGKKIQDLLYPLALSGTSEFAGANRFTSLYLALNDAIDESAVIRLGLPEASGATNRTIDETHELLVENLKLFAGAVLTGHFPINQEKNSESSLYCPTCKKIGARATFQATMFGLDTVAESSELGEGAEDVKDK